MTATVPEKKRNIAIVLSAGRGNRMHADRPKQYLDLCGRPVIAWSLYAFEGFADVDDVILVTGSDDIDYCRSEIVDRYGLKKVRSIVPGGAERYLSVWEGLKEAKRLLNDQYGQAGEGSYLFIHDGARPLVDDGILERCLADARQYHACVAAMPVKDTIRIADDNAFSLETPARRSVWQIQTPQVFSFPLVYESYRKLIDAGAADVTDDAMVVERESSVRAKLTEGSYRNLKITTPEDLEIAQMWKERAR